MAFSQPILSHGSVQELAKQDNLTVPHNYVQEHREPTFVPNDVSLLPSIPVIDMNNLVTEGLNRELYLKNLRSICCNWGIFQLVNHGVDKSLVDKMKSEVIGFFESPIEEKLKYKLKGGEYEGYGQTILHAQGQKIDWADRFFMITNPLHRRKPDLLPAFPPLLRSLIHSITPRAFRNPLRVIMYY
ncbi:putative thebaine 6-O-demethylase [Helianthus debilis subsp. tardiflorus]